MISLRTLFGLMLALFAASQLSPDAAMAKRGPSGMRTVLTASWVEEWDPASQRWVRVEDASASPAARSAQTSVITAQGAIITETVTPAPAKFGFVRPTLQQARGGAGAAIAQYGPFRVLDETRAALVAATDISSPRQFEAMLRDHPGLAVIEMIDAPGTSHDLANLALGRKIRAAGLATHVPTGGSVRSGAVELFLAGKQQTIAPGASFAVHSWLDTRGLEPRHFGEDAPENRLYLDYYIEMGMAPDHARAFYAMTNSVPHSDALWLDAATMQQWIAPMATAAGAARSVAAPAPMIIAQAEAAVDDALRHGAAEAAGTMLALHHQALIGDAQSLWQALTGDDLQHGDWAEAPVLPYLDLGPVMLARLDS